MSQILDNAIRSIELGVRDYLSDEEGRALSAVRNVYAGVLLLCKEVLWHKSPDDEGSLIFSRLLPQKQEDGSIQWTPRGKRTVTRNEIRERFDALGISVDWTPIERLATLRNDIEHFYSEQSDELIKEALFEATPVIRDLLVKELDEYPAEVFSEDCWAALLENEKVQQAERDHCAVSFEMVVWPSDGVKRPFREMRCGHCASFLVQQNHPSNTIVSEMTLSCRQCGEHQELEAVLPLAIDKVTEVESYFAAKDGGDAPVADCPECGRYTFIREVGQCVICDFSIDKDCMRCGASIPPEEYRTEHPELCGYCAHMLDKLLAED